MKIYVYIHPTEFLKTPMFPHSTKVFVCTYGLEASSNDALWRLRQLGYAAAGSVWNEDGHGFEWVKACPAPWTATTGHAMKSTGWAPPSDVC